MTLVKHRHHPTMASALTLLNQEKKRLTAFQLKVYSALCHVPRGKVTTYKLLAKSIGCNSSQAIGQALKRNPCAPVVPCHRVVQSDLSLGGFAGHRTGEKINKKIQLLQAENVRFDSEGRIARDCLYFFD